jgi:glycosyltransferase involved in cell wall biosynthesis
LIPFRVGVQQRVFPAYRAPFFDALARSCVGGLSVFAGEPMTWEALGKEGELKIAQRVNAENLYIGWGSLLSVWQRGLKDWLERWRPDVLIMEANPRNVSTNLAVRWMHAHHRPVIGWGLGAPRVSGSFSTIFANSRRGFLAQFDALVSYSRTGVEQYQSTGFPSARIFLAPNAATPRPMQAPPPRLPVYRDGKPVILFVGRLQARKRVGSLLHACARLPVEIQPRLIIVGDGPAREEFEATAREYYPSAEFIGARHGDALSPFYNAADLFVLPGTGGLAVQEAMSHGLPVMVAEADGTQADLVRDNNGWLLPPNDDDALNRALEIALRNPLLLRQMGQESYRIVAEEVNLEKMVDVFAEVIKSLTAKDAKVEVR